MLAVAMVGAASVEDRLLEVDSIEGRTVLEDGAERVASEENDDGVGTAALGSMVIDGMLVARDSPLADAVGTTDVAITDDVGRESVSVAAINSVASGSSVVVVPVETATGADLVTLCVSQLTPRWPTYMISSSCHTASSIARTRAASVDPWTTPYLAIDSRFLRMDSSQ